MFRFFAKKEPYIESEILNYGLKLHIGFLSPIRNRLAKIFPALSDGELDVYENQCSKAMEAGHSYVYSRFEMRERNFSLKDFSEEMIKQYPWINKTNLKKLLNQGKYLAFKDMGFEKPSN